MEPNDNIEEKVNEIKAKHELDYDASLFADTPPWYAQWGFSVLCIICLFFIGMSWFVKYPDTIASSITIKTSVSPRPITSVVDGRIKELKVKDGQIVSKGQILVVIENDVNYNDASLLSDYLKILDRYIIDSKFDSITMSEFPKLRALGSLQPFYQQLIISLQTLRAFNEGGVFFNIGKLYNNEMSNSSVLKKNLFAQLEELKKELKISENEYINNLNLFWGEAISLQELKTIESKLISKRLVVKQLESQITLNDNSQMGIQRKALDQRVEIQNEQINLSKILVLLKTEILTWELKYLIKSPDRGKVSFVSLLDNYNLVERNQELFYVLQDQTTFVGEIYLGQDKLGSVNPGQKVIIRLKSYPYEEYGMLIGNVLNISDIDMNQKYLIRVSLPNDLLTSFHKKLKYRYGLVGDAEIITAKKRLLQKFFGKFMTSGSE